MSVAFTSQMALMRMRCTPGLAVGGIVILKLVGFGVVTGFHPRIGATASPAEKIPSSLKSIQTSSN
jgi:hypothetical protein